MSDVQATTPSPAAARRVSNTAILVMVLLVLALAGGTAKVFSEIKSLRGEVTDLKGQVSSMQAAANEAATSVDSAFSPVAVGHAQAAKAKLDAGDEAGAMEELEQAQVLARSINRLGTGMPPDVLVAALTSVESAVGEPITLAPKSPGPT